MNITIDRSEWVDSVARKTCAGHHRIQVKATVFGVTQLLVLMSVLKPSTTVLMMTMLMSRSY